MNGFKLYRGKLGQSVGKYNLIVRTSEHRKGLPEAYVEFPPLEIFIFYAKIYREHFISN